MVVRLNKFYVVGKGEKRGAKGENVVFLREREGVKGGQD